MPFTHRDTMRTAMATGVSPEMAAELVTRFITDAMGKRGIQVIPASDPALRRGSSRSSSAGSLAAAVTSGAALVRVHDVAETVDCLSTLQAIRQGECA